MIVPSPLCLLQLGTASTAGEFTCSYGFIPYVTEEIESAFHDQGQRSVSGAQTGLVAAHIEGDISPYAPLFRPGYVVNGPSSNMTTWRALSVAGSITSTFTSAFGWQDSQYCYCGVGNLSFLVSYRNKRVELRLHTIGVTLWRRSNDEAWPEPPYPNRVQLRNCERADASESRSDQLIEAWDDVESLVDARAIHDTVPITPTTAYRWILRAAQAARPQNWRTQTPYAYIYTDLQKGIDYRKIIQHLLHDYRFSDPLLAKGLVAPTRSEVVVTGDYNPLTHRRDSKVVTVARSGPFGTYLFEWLTQHAFYDALSGIRRANANSIQNVLSAFDLLVSIKTGDFSDVTELLSRKWQEWTKDATSAGKFISSLWLRYRYEVTTTNMDLKEYGDYLVDYLERMARGNRPSRVHGFAKYDDTVCFCSLSWSEKFVSTLASTAHSLWKTGLLPDEYVFWDLVPFSFIADWNSSMPDTLRRLGLAPPWSGNVGDILEVQSNKRFLNTGFYNISDVVFSLRYDTSLGGLTGSHYVRFVDYTPTIQLDYWFDSGEAKTSLSTLVKRGTDGAALTTGFVL